jgi:enoyl-CoA hydratase/carnithine racemase
MTASLRLDLDGRIAVLHLTDGENRMRTDWVAAVDAALDEVEAARAVLITIGEGKFFSNGLDLDWLMSGADTAGFFEGLHALFARLLTFPTATAAAINGHAFGAGLQLALAHDHRVMRVDRGYACMPEIDIGAPLTAGMNAIMRATVPPDTLRRMMTSGHRYDGPEAVADRFVHAAVDEDRVLAEAIAAVEPLVGRDPDTMHRIKVDLFREWLPVMDPERWPG